MTRFKSTKACGSNLRGESMDELPSQLWRFRRSRNGSYAIWRHHDFIVSCEESINPAYMKTKISLLLIPVLAFRLQPWKLSATGCLSQHRGGQNASLGPHRHTYGDWLVHKQPHRRLQHGYRLDASPTPPTTTPAFGTGALLNNFTGANNTAMECSRSFDNLR